MFSLSIRDCKNKQQKYVSVLFLFYFLLIVKKINYCWINYDTNHLNEDTHYLFNNSRINYDTK